MEVGLLISSPKAREGARRVGEEIREVAQVVPQALHRVTRERPRLASVEVASGQDAMQAAVCVAAQGLDRGVGGREGFLQREEHAVLHARDVEVNAGAVQAVAHQYRPSRWVDRFRAAVHEAERGVETLRGSRQTTAMRALELAEDPVFASQTRTSGGIACLHIHAKRGQLPCRLNKCPPELRLASRSATGPVFLPRPSSSPQDLVASSQLPL